MGFKMGKMFKLPKVVDMGKMTGIKKSDLGLPSVKVKKRRRPSIKNILKDV